MSHSLCHICLSSVLIFLLSNENPPVARPLPDIGNRFVAVEYLHFHVLIGVRQDGGCTNLCLLGYDSGCFLDVGKCCWSYRQGPTIAEWSPSKDARACIVSTLSEALSTTVRRGNRGSRHPPPTLQQSQAHTPAIYVLSQLSLVDWLGQKLVLTTRGSHQSRIDSP